MAKVLQTGRNHCGKTNVTETMKFVLERVENIGEKEKMLVTRIFSFSHNVFGKGENAGYQDFLLFPRCFQMASHSGSLKSESCDKGLICTSLPFVVVDLLTHNPDFE